MSQRYVLIEALEDRRFLSATLAPSAVEGTYTGTATEKGTGSEAFTVKITATTETVTITGYGSESIKLSAAAFKKLRAGTFSYSGKIKAISVSLSGTVSKAGKVISGKVTAKGTKTVTGTFTVTKS